MKLGRQGESERGEAVGIRDQFKTEREMQRKLTSSTGKGHMKGMCRVPAVVVRAHRQAVQKYMQNNQARAACNVCRQSSSELLLVGPRHVRN